MLLILDFSLCREIFVFTNFVVFLSRSLFNARCRGRCKKAWHYVFQLVDRLCNDCFKLKYLCLFSLHLVDN